MTRPPVRRPRGPCAAMLLAACTAAAAASFDCTRATGRVERLVCADAGLSALDDELADAHAMQPQGGKAAARLRATQRAWLRTRDACADAACVRGSIERRIAELACDPASTAAGSAAGRSACARARLRLLDRELDERAGAAAEMLSAWRRGRRDRCAERGRSDGGAPGWQHAMALACEVEEAEERLASAGARNPR